MALERDVEYSKCIPSYLDMELKQVLRRLRPHSDPRGGIPFVVTAAKLGDRDAITVLHKHGFNIDQKTIGTGPDNPCQSAIFTTVLKNDLDATELLISLGAEVNVTDSVVTTSWGGGRFVERTSVCRTPLEYAASQTKSLRMVKLLIEEGKADVHFGLRPQYLDKTTPEIRDYVNQVKKEQNENPVAQNRADWRSVRSTQRSFTLSR